MSKRPQVRPPRKPKGEPAKVTIDNQRRQLSLLLQRVEDLVEERGALKLERDALKQHGGRNSSTIEGLQREVQTSRNENNYNRGYIARVKETDKI